MPGALGHLNRDRAGGRVDALGLAAVGMAPAAGRALVMPGAEKALAEGPMASSKARAKMFAMSPAPCSIICSRTASSPVFFPLSIPGPPRLVLQLHGIPEWTAPAGTCPGRGAQRNLRQNFQTSGYSTRSGCGARQAVAIGRLRYMYVPVENSCLFRCGILGENGSGRHFHRSDEFYRCLGEFCPMLLIVPCSPTC